MEEFEGYVASLYKSHFTPESPNGLWHPDEAPNTNTIYKLWNDGEMTREKGGDAFGNRSLHQVYPALVTTMIENEKLPKFPCESSPYSYAILTFDECVECRDRMKEILDIYIYKMYEVRCSPGVTYTNKFHVHQRSTNGDFWIVGVSNVTDEDAQNLIRESFDESVTIHRRN